MKLCSIEGCEKPVHNIRGWCSKHYQRWRRYGDAEAPYQVEKELSPAFKRGDWSKVLERIQARTNLDAVTGCWNWSGSKDRDGYGIALIDGKPWRSHRLAVTAALGREITDSLVHHKCANRSCCNPEHLQTVDDFSNRSEMFERNNYIKRIEALEEALREKDPENPLLT